MEDVAARDEVAPAKQLADRLGISKHTVTKWGSRHPEFRDAAINPGGEVVYVVDEVLVWLVRTGRHDVLARLSDSDRRRAQRLAKKADSTPKENP